MSAGDPLYGKNALTSGEASYSLRIVSSAASWECPVGLYGVGCGATQFGPMTSSGLCTVCEVKLALLEKERSAEGKEDFTLVRPFDLLGLGVR